MRAVLLALAMMFGASGAGAATMTFGGLTEEGFDDQGNAITTLVENGITATAFGGTLGHSGRPGTAHMDDSGTSFARAIRFTMADPFDARSFDIIPLGFGFFDCEDARCASLAFPNVKVKGLRDGQVVARSVFDMYDVNGTFTFGEEFSSLSAVVILFAPFTASVPRDLCDDPCSHFAIDSITLTQVAPVPLPASAAALALGLGALGLVAAKRRRMRG